MMPFQFQQFITAVLLAGLANGQLMDIKRIDNATDVRTGLSLNVTDGTLRVNQQPGQASLYQVEDPGGPAIPLSGWRRWTAGAGFSLMVHSLASVGDTYSKIRDGCEGVDLIRGSNWDKGECIVAWISEFGRAALSVGLGSETRIRTDEPGAQVAVVAMTSKISSWFGTSTKKRGKDELKKRELAERYDTEDVWTSYCDLWWQTSESAYWANDKWTFDVGQATIKLTLILDCHNQWDFSHPSMADNIMSILNLGAGSEHTEMYIAIVEDSTQNVHGYLKFEMVDNAAVGWCPPGFGNKVVTYLVLGYPLGD